jgi:hypothetical protein
MTKIGLTKDEKTCNICSERMFINIQDNNIENSYNKIRFNYECEFCMNIIDGYKNTVFEKIGISLKSFLFIVYFYSINLKVNDNLSVLNMFSINLNAKTIYKYFSNIRNIINDYFINNIPFFHLSGHVEIDEC